jgi:glycosyltransferase involved in cell wall biosynthesis
MSEKKTITFLINSLNVGGAEKVCVTLCNGLVNKGVNVSLIVVHPSTPLESKLDERVNLIKLGYDKIYKASWGIVNVCRKLKTDSLMVFDPELYVLAHISKTIFCKKFKLIFRCINTLSKSFQYYSTNRQKYLNKPLIKTVLRLSDNIIAQSTGMKADLVNNFKVEESKITVIPNPAIMLSKIDENEAIAKEKIVLFVGRIAPQKGLNYLFEAFEKVIRLYPSYKLLIVGKGQEPYESEIKNLANEMNLTNNISFEGNQSNVSTFYKRAKLTVLTSLFEGFPNVLVESISLGTPVVSFDCKSGPRDIIENDINGILVPYLDVNFFAKSIESVISNQKVFYEEDVIRSSKKFHIEAIIEDYEKIIF